MTFDEARMWMAYVKKKGSLNIGMRLEIGFGQMMAMIANALRDPKKSQPFSPIDFMPHVEEPEMTLEEAMKQWR